MGKSFRRGAAVLAVLSLLAAGCRDDSADAPDEQPDATTPDTPDGSTTLPEGDEPPTTSAPAEPTDERAFSVMVIGDETSTISFEVPEAVPAVQGALAELPNVEVLHCDSAGDANVSDDCQREAVEAGVAAVIASFGQIGQSATVLSDAGIPIVGGAPANVPFAYSTSSGLAAYASLGAAVSEAACGTFATLFLDGADFLADMVREGAGLDGIEEVGRSAIPQNTPDISPQVAALASTDADCLVLSVTPAQVIQAVTALDQAGVEAQLIAIDAVFSADAVAELGELAEGALVSSVQLNASDPDPAVAQATADMHAFDPDATMSTVGLLSWASAKLIIDALPAIDGEVTAASLDAALATLENATAGGVTHPISTTESLTNPLFNRFFNPWGLLYRIEDGTPVRITDDFFSLAAVIEVAEIG